MTKHSLLIREGMNKARSRSSLSTVPGMLKDALDELLKNDPLRMAGATAFFTVFALPPILIILIQLLGLVFNERKVSENLFEGMESVIQRESVQQIVHTLAAFENLANNWFVALAGFIFLVFVATTLFKVIKSSVNQLWKIRVMKRRSLWVNVRTRIQSVFVIFMAAVLFIPGVIVTGLRAFLTGYVYQLSPGLTFYFNSGLNFLFSIVIVTVWFAIVFRFLPDGRPGWKVALTGAFVTNILFNTGKVILRWSLIHSNIHSIYGASASIVLLLLFVFYSSLILYFGAAFTKIWGAWHNQPIKPLPHAMHYKLAQVDEEG